MTDQLTGCDTYERRPMETADDHDYFRPEWIWANDDGTTVYAQGYGRDVNVIFSLHADRDNPPTSLANRICTKYRKLDDEDLPVIKNSSTSSFSTFEDARDANESGTRLALELKAHWCANMAVAVFHTHRIARTYHMDIKPGDFVAHANDDLLLCDWEQLDAPATTIAPGADGTWDVMEEQQTTASQDGGGRPRLRYTKYSGPPRQNVDEDDVIGNAPWHTWSVFPTWNKEHPWALELAEVFSLGRSMWMLLRQPEMDFEDIDHPDQLTTDWDKSEDVPMTWKQIVDRCMLRDPNERPDLADLVDFWTNEWNAQKVVSGKSQMKIGSECKQSVEVHFDFDVSFRHNC